MSPYVQFDGENFCAKDVQSGDAWEDVVSFWYKVKQQNNEAFYTYLTGELLDN